MGFDGLAHGEWNRPRGSVGPGIVDLVSAEKVLVIEMLGLWLGIGVIELLLCLSGRSPGLHVKYK